MATIVQAFGFGAGGFIFTYLPAKVLFWILRINLPQKTDTLVARCLFGAFFVWGLIKFSLDAPA